MIGVIEEVKTDRGERKQKMDEHSSSIWIRLGRWEKKAALVF